METNKEALVRVLSGDDSLDFVEALQDVVRPDFMEGTTNNLDDKYDVHMPDTLLLSHAFVWGRSEKGKEFWEGIHRQLVPF